MKFQRLMVPFSIAVLGAGCAANLDSQEGHDQNASTDEQAVSDACGAAGKFCAPELGFPVGDERLLDCASAGAAPTVITTCPTYCVVADASRFSFCGTIATMPAADLAVFANPNLAGAAHGELLWDDLKDVDGKITALGGHSLVDANKVASKTCKDSATEQCTNAGGECAAFAEWESGAPSTSSWGQLDDAQLSIANAPNGTLLATFVDRKYGGLPHAMFKCGGYFCDANWGLDRLVRRHSFTAAQLVPYGFHVVAR